MNKVAFIILALAAVLVSCSKESDVASPACVDLAKTTDPATSAELQKRCPRAGKFKPSQPKNW